MAHVDQPVRGGDDALRRAAARALPAHPHRPSVAGLWLFPPYPNANDADGANFKEPAHLGRLRGCSTYGTVSPRSSGTTGSYPRTSATFRGRAKEQDALRRCYGCSRWAWRGLCAATGLRYEKAYLLARGLSTPARALGSHVVELRLRGRRCCRAGTRRSSRLLRRRRDLRRLRDGADARRFRCASCYKLHGLHHDAATSRTWRRSRS
jgi:hypothetical protein